MMNPEQMIKAAGNMDRQEGQSKNLATSYFFTENIAIKRYFKKMQLGNKAKIKCFTGSKNNNWSDHIQEIATYFQVVVSPHTHPVCQ